MSESVGVKPTGGMKVSGGAALAGTLVLRKDTGSDPKPSELSLGRMKPGETLVEVRMGADVQIAPRTWV